MPLEEETVADDIDELRSPVSGCEVLPLAVT